MKEQPSQSNPEDLFEWGGRNNPQSTKTTSEIPAEKISEDRSEPECAQCELGAHCSRHGPKKPYPASMPTFAIVEPDVPQLTDEDRRSSEHLADLELERKRLEDEENRQLTPEELDKFFKGMYRDLFGKAS